MDELSYTIDIAVGRRRLVSVNGFRFARGRITLLLGESGLGKTLIARALYGLLDPAESRIRINGLDYRTYLKDRSLRMIRKRGFFVFQEPSSHLNPLLTIREQLGEGDLVNGPDPAVSLMQLWEGEYVREVRDLLALYPQPYRPSGGEKQRVLLAMALRKMDMLHESAGDPGEALFVFDEPTGSLDNQYRDLFLSLLLARFRQVPSTILFITHDYSLIRHISTVHRDIARRVDYRELALSGGKLAFREFRAASYSTWLESLDRSSGRREGDSSTPLLTVGDSMRVFGRVLRLTTDREGVRPASLKVRPGKLAYLKAPSGTGKTTVAKALMGLIPAETMSADLLGTALDQSSPRSLWQRKIWGKMMTMVFQHADEALNMNATAEETLRYPSRRNPGVATPRGILGDLFDDGSIGELMKKKIWMLSGGQKQRLNLLRGLALGVEVLILDEPLNGLDFESCTRVIAMLRHQLAQGKGILVISHNEEIFDAITEEDDRYYLRALPA